MKYKKFIFLIALSLLALPIVSFAQPAGGNALTTFVANVEAAATTIAISIVIIGWIIAGILYLVSAGSPEKTGTAKKALIAAIIGTILIVLAPIAKAVIDALLKQGA